MSNLRFLWDYSRFDQAGLTAGSQKAGLPVQNLQNTLRKKVWKTDGTGVSHVDVDFGGPVTCNALGLVEHNFYSAAKIKVIAYEDAWISAIFVREFNVFESIIGWGDGEWGSVNFGGLPDEAVLESLPRITNTFFWSDVTVNSRYWRIEIDNANSEFYLGRMFLGTYWEPEVNFSYGWRMTLEDPSRTELSIGGQKWTDLKERFYKLKFSLENMREADVFGRFLRAVKRAGVGRDIILCLSDRPGYLRYYTSMYGRFTRIPEVENPHFGLYGTSIEFEESL